MEIIDAHHHLWDLNQFPYLWLAPEAGPRPFGDHASIKRNYEFSHYIDDTRSENVVASVLVQANVGTDDPVAEINWLAEEADRAGRRVAIVGQADIFSPDFERHLDLQMRNPYFRGVRVFAGWDNDPLWRQTPRKDLLFSPEFASALDALAARNLSLDLALLPTGLYDLGKILGNMRDLPIAINHLGTLRFDQPSEFQTWKAAVRKLSNSPQVHMKISGLWSVDQNWNPDQIHTPLAFLLQHFGASRCMYGSNLPVENVMLSFSQQIQSLRSAIKVNTDKMGAIVRQTAARFYNLLT
tara:strand:+ start:772 stop:1662 length:891 start_codon:yes stop_codon:yes gene_type:complete